MPRKTEQAKIQTPLENSLFSYVLSSDCLNTKIESDQKIARILSIPPPPPPPPNGGNFPQPLQKKILNSDNPLRCLISNPKNETNIPA